MGTERRSWMPFPSFPPQTQNFFPLQSQTAANSYGWMGESRGLRLQWALSRENNEILFPRGLSKCPENNVKGQEWRMEGSKSWEDQAVRTKVNSGPVWPCWVFLPQWAQGEAERELSSVLFSWGSVRSLEGGGFLQVPHRVLAASIIQPAGTEISLPSAICGTPTTWTHKPPYPET